MEFNFFVSVVVVYPNSRMDIESTDTKSMSLVAFQYGFHYSYAAWHRQSVG